MNGSKNANNRQKIYWDGEACDMPMAGADCFK